MIHVDGSEGGGQIIRTALALSTLTGKPFTATDIRKGRKEPGLKHQHLYGGKACAQLCDADVVGLELGSTSLDFYPKALKVKHLNIDVETAGSLTLLFQSIFLPSMFGSDLVVIKGRGGTDTKWSPQMDYFTNVFLPFTKRYCESDLFLEARGYYPAGGGKVKLRLRPKFHHKDYETFDKLFEDTDKIGKKMDFTKRGRLVEISGVSHASKDLMKAEVAERQARAARFILRQLDVPAKIRIEHCDTQSTGSGITLWAGFADDEEMTILGADSLGERGKRAEAVGQEAAKQLLEEIDSGACVDRHMADQILPVMAMFPDCRVSISQITDHVRSNIYVIEQFLPVKFRFEGNVIVCEKV